MPDGLHLKEGGNAVNALPALAIKGVGAIFHPVGATRNSGDVLRRTLLSFGEQFVGAAPQVIAVDISVTHQMR